MKIFTEYIIFIHTHLHVSSTELYEKYVVIRRNPPCIQDPVPLPILPERTSLRTVPAVIGDVSQTVHYSAMFLAPPFDCQ